MLIVIVKVRFWLKGEFYYVFVFPIFKFFIEMTNDAGVVLTILVIGKASFSFSLCVKIIDSLPNVFNKLYKEVFPY